jgi:2'-5' RNA ligase
MAYAFCLRFDAETEAAVSAVWTALADAGISEDMLRLGYAPHLSLAVLDDEPSQDVVEGALTSLPGYGALSLQLGGVRQFEGTSIVWLAVDGGAALTDLHTRLLAVLPVNQVRTHYRPNQWVPHVTLQMLGNVDTAMALVAEQWPAQVLARAIRLELVRFPPVIVQRSFALV